MINYNIHEIPTLVYTVYSFHFLLVWFRVTIGSLEKSMI